LKRFLARRKPLKRLKFIARWHTGLKARVNAILRHDFLRIGIDFFRQQTRPDTEHEQAREHRDVDAQVQLAHQSCALANT
jgi:hypothetical protein